MNRPLFSTANAAGTAAPAQHADHSQGGDLGQRYRQLRQEHDRLNEKRMRHTLLLQQATEEDERCQREAAAFGASSPEELETILARRREEAAQGLEAFEKALAQEAALQQQVEQDLAAAENR